MAPLDVLQLRLIWVAEAALAVRLVGADGAVVGAPDSGCDMKNAYMFWDSLGPLGSVNEPALEPPDRAIASLKATCSETSRPAPSRPQ